MIVTNVSELRATILHDFAYNVRAAKAYCERIAAQDGPLSETYAAVAARFDHDIDVLKDIREWAKR